MPQIENKLPKRSPFVLWGSFAAVAIAIALVFVNLSPQKETPQVSDAELAQFLFSDDYFSENGDDIGNEYLEIIDL